MASNNNPRLQMLLEEQAQYNAQQAQLNAQFNARKARIDAEIASLGTSNAQYHASSHGLPSRHRRRSQVTSRSASHSGSISKTRSSPGHGRHDSVPMSASISQHSAPSMARHGSKGSSSSIPSMPFSNPTGHLPPPLQNRQQHNLRIESYVSRQDDPLNDWTFQSSMSQRQTLEKLPELDYGEDPQAYFARTTDIAPTFSVTPSPIEAPPPSQFQNPQRLSVSSRRQSFGFPAPPSTATLTNATTASDMSRSGSINSDGINGPFEMINIHSNNSFYNSSFDTSYPSIQIPPSQSKSFSSEEQTLLVTGVGASHNSFSIFHSPDSTNQVLSPFEDLKRSQSNESLDMERSDTSGSNSTTSSSMSRSRLQLQNQTAKTRIIAPKTENDDASWNASLEKSKSGTSEPIAIPKQPYQRPKRDRVYCDHCTDSADGFRGAHELGRHMDRQHKALVRNWVCVEPENGVSQVTPLNPLSQCKACKNGRKYGAYYNAAAHLRRAHFNPKPRVRGKAKLEDKSEKRGGKGGGNLPAMNLLKCWMKEVFVHRSENEQAIDEDDDCDVENEYYATAPHMSGAPILNNNNNNTNTNYSLEQNYFEQFPSCNTQGMSDMHFDSSSLHPQQQLVDSSMGYAEELLFNQMLTNDPHQLRTFANDQIHFPQSYDQSSSTDLLPYQTYNLDM